MSAVEAARINELEDNPLTRRKLMPDDFWDRPLFDHKGTEHLAINNTLLRCVLTRLARRTLGRFHKSHWPVTPLSKTLLIKAGRRVHLIEAATMEYVRSRTSIPVPKVYCSFVHKGQAYILMERIQGKCIPLVWGKLSSLARQRVYDQLKVLIQELRTLKPPPGTGVESCTGDSLYDCRIKHSWGRFGPFKTIQDFHFWLREGTRLAHIEGHPDPTGELHKIKQMIEMQDGPWLPPVFTHADLNPANIILRDEKVVGIIDWEFSGCYPHYWEYSSAWHGNLTTTDWQRELDKFLEPFPKELTMEHTRNQYWGEI